MSDQPVPQRIGDAERDRAVECLQEHMAQGRLDQNEFDERMQAALAAKVQSDLDPLFGDLPEPKPVPPRPIGQLAPAAIAATGPGYEPAVRPAAEVAPQRGYEVALGTIAAVAWPATIILFLATNWWGFWWIWLIPVMLTGAFGRYRHDRRDDRRR